METEQKSAGASSTSSSGRSSLTYTTYEANSWAATFTQSGEKRM